MNEGDLGNKAADLFLEVSLYNAQKVTGNERLTGWCLNQCGEPTRGSYCSKECREDHTKILRMKK